MPPAGSAVGRFGPSRDAALVTRAPDGTALAQADAAGLTGGTLDEILRAVLRRREAGFSHGMLGGDTVVVTGRGICVRNFRRASASAPASRLDTDLAAVLAAMAVRAGAERTAAAAARVLGAAVHAVGQQASLATLITVNTLAAILGGAVPVPGGLGVVEAGLIAGLASAGLPQDQAVAAVLIQRFFASYLPPVWGWLTLAWMRRREYV